MKKFIILITQTVAILCLLMGCKEEYVFEMDPRLKGKQVYTNPITSFDWPDPTIWTDDNGIFYSIATIGRREKNIHTSNDMITWVDSGCSVFEDSTYKLLRSYGEAIWAPDVIFHNNKYIMYVALYNSFEDTSIAALTSENPLGPFKFANIITRSVDNGIADSIDPEVVYDTETDKLWLFWGSSYGIYRMALTNDGLAIADYQITHVAGRNAAEFPNRDKVFEGSYIYRKDGYWYLFVSSGVYLNDSYKLLVGRSESLTLPFYDMEGRPMTEGYASIILKSDPSRTFYSPGHNGEIIFDKSGKTYMYFHCRFRPWDRTPRYMMLQEVLWDDNGWPYFRDGVPTRYEEKPNI